MCAIERRFESKGYFLTDWNHGNILYYDAAQDDKPARDLRALEQKDREDRGGAGGVDPGANAGGADGAPADQRPGRREEKSQPPNQDDAASRLGGCDFFLSDMESLVTEAEGEALEAFARKREEEAKKWKESEAIWRDALSAGDGDELVKARNEVWRLEGEARALGDEARELLTDCPVLNWSIETAAPEILHVDAEISRAKTRRRPVEASTGAGVRRTNFKFGPKAATFGMVRTLLIFLITPTTKSFVKGCGLTEDQQVAAEKFILSVEKWDWTTSGGDEADDEEV